MAYSFTDRGRTYQGTEATGFSGTGATRSDAPGQDSEAITSSTLQVQTPFKIEPIPITTATDGMLAGLETQSDSFVKNLETEAAKAEQNAGGSLEALLGEMVNAEGQTSLENRAYAEEGGVNDIQRELTSINQQLLEEQQSNRRRIEAIEKNPTGMLREQLQNEVQRVNTESLKRQADLSIIQMGIQGRFSDAKQFADRAISAQLEGQKQRLDILQFVYNENKDLFNKAEQREFEAKQADRERAIKKEESELKDISDYSIDALQNGAPKSIVAQMQQAKTREEAIRIGGQYIGKLDRDYKIAQINKIGMDNILASAAAEDRKNGILDEKDISAIDKSPQGKKLQTASDLKMKLSSYQSLVDQFGMESVGSNKAVLESAYTALQLAYKEAANLGVLNGPDLTLVEKAIRSATPGFWGTIGNIGGARTRSLKAGLEQAQTTLDSAAGQALEELYARDPVYRDSLYINSIILPFGDTLITSGEEAEMDSALNQ